MYPNLLVNYNRSTIYILKCILNFLHCRKTCPTVYDHTNIQMLLSNKSHKKPHAETFVLITNPFVIFWDDGCPHPAPPAVTLLLITCPQDIWAPAAYLIIQLIVFRSQCSGLISCKPPCVTCQLKKKEKKREMICIKTSSVAGRHRLTGECFNQNCECDDSIGWEFRWNHFQSLVELKWKSLQC